MTAETVSSESPDRLRADLVAKLWESGSLRSPVVAEAFATVPREKFAPEASLAAAYSFRDVVVTKRNAAGRAIEQLPGDPAPDGLAQDLAPPPGGRVGP